MPTKTDLLVSNLQETIKSLQMFMLSGLGAALFFVLLAFSSKKEVTLQAPAVGSSLPISSNIALALSLSVYWIAGLMATLLVARANRLVHILRKESPELVEPVLLYPSVVTLRVYGPRLGLAILPAVLVIVGSVQFWGRQLYSLWPAIGLFFLAVPFPILAIELRSAIGGYTPSYWGD
jgi:hypothetical protein